MFKTITELQAFITWAKTEKVKRIKVDNVEIEISDYAFLGDLVSSHPLAPLDASSSNVLRTPEQVAKDEEDLLFHSAQ